MKPHAERMAEIGERQAAINAALLSLREVREGAIADEDNAKAERLRIESERLAREFDDLTTKAEVLTRRHEETEQAEMLRRQQAAAARLAELNRVRARSAGRSTWRGPRWRTR